MDNLQQLAQLRAALGPDDSMKELAGLVGIMNAMQSPIRQDQQYQDDLAYRQNAQRIQQEQFGVNTGLAQDRIAMTQDEQDEASMRWEAEFGLRKLTEEQAQLGRVNERKDIQDRAEMNQLLQLAQLGLGGGYGQPARNVDMGMLDEEIGTRLPGLAGIFSGAGNAQTERDPLDDGTLTPHQSEILRKRREAGL